MIKDEEKSSGKELKTVITFNPNNRYSRLNSTIIDIN